MAPSKKDVGEGKVKKVKKTKDPNAPKRPVSAYMLWLNENRSRLTKPGMGVTDVARAAGVEWRSLNDKKRWQDMYEKEKARYQKEIANYTNSAEK